MIDLHLKSALDLAKLVGARDVQIAALEQRVIALTLCVLRLQRLSHDRAVELENVNAGDEDTRAHTGTAETPDELYLSFDHCQHPDCRAALDATKAP
jgi:hypothetical protein